MLCHISDQSGGLMKIMIEIIQYILAGFYGLITLAFFAGVIGSVVAFIILLFGRNDNDV
jgi:hypothetical protein